MKYPKTKAPDHPRADITGHVPTHILLMEKELGRFLEKNEVVHHCDFNKSNYGNIKGETVSNLLLMSSRQEHQQLPELQARFLIQMHLYEKFLEWWMEEKEIVQIERKLEKVQKRLTDFRRKNHE